MRARSFRKQAVIAAVVAIAGGLGAAVPAVASPVPGQPEPAGHQASARPALPAGERYVCPPPARTGQMECMSIVKSPRRGVNPATAKVTNGNYGPSQLQSAYKLTSASAKKGKGVTVAIVDAYQDPDAAGDLGHYRSHFHLSACTIANKCLKIVNEAGKTSPLPAKMANWATEESLDLDMVSAICPNCHILLVEAASAATSDLGTAEDTAIRLGARYVSNSWSGDEFTGQDADNSFFNHPGDVLAFAADDFGYGPQYPTDLQYVTAVGGTTLKHASNSRGWAESAWGFSDVQEGTGSGCSEYEPKPTWQHADADLPDGCLNRTETDVSADADPNSGVLVYDSYGPGATGFTVLGGTSEATPIITATYALAGTPARGSYPAEYPYLHAKDLFDVTSGVNGVCETYRQYLCHGEKGYDGPTGLGTPDGTGAFASGTAHRVTLVDPGVQDFAAGGSMTLPITGLDTSHASALQWTATGLPSGLSIHAVSKSTNARITGTLPATPGSFSVTVTGKDGSASSTAHFTIVTIPSVAAPNPPSGDVTMTVSSSLCLDGGADASGDAVEVRKCAEARIGSQDWQYVATGQAADVGTFQIAGQCVTVAPGAAPQPATLTPCSGNAGQAWAYLGFGQFQNPSTGGCLNSSGLKAGSAVESAACVFDGSSKVKYQTWNLPPGPIVTGAGQLCLDNTTGSTIKVEPCDYSDQPAQAGQLWALLGTGLAESSGGQCLAITSLLAKTALTLEPCDSSDGFQSWYPGPSGEFQTFSANNSGIAYNTCLTDPGNGAAGTTPDMDQCYGYSGQIWGLS